MTHKTVRLTNRDGSLRPFERIVDDILMLALDHCGGRKTVVARQLQIGRSTLYTKLREGA